MFIIRYTKQFLIVAIGIVVASMLALGVFGLNLGIDFTGGALTEVVYDNSVQFREPIENQVTHELRALEFELGGLSLRSSTGEDGRAGFILRTRDLSEDERIAVQGVLTSVLPSGEIMRFTSIGPVIGEELKSKAVWAIGFVVVIIILYVAFAFRKVSTPVNSWAYGLITIAALVHDVLIPTAFFGILGYFFGVEVDVLFVMAILAVLGYSVNDTIVVFDRVRENLAKNIEAEKQEPFKDVVGRSLKQTFTRSINTSITTALALLALYFLGGEVTQNFALVLLVGVIAGTYSSLFIASPLLVWVESKKKTKPQQDAQP